MKTKLDWNFTEYEFGGTKIPVMWEFSNGAVCVQMYVPQKGWIEGPTTHHVGPDPIRTARMLFRELAQVHYTVAA